MEQYKVILRQLAYEDLREIYSHIAYELHEPLAAERIHACIAEAICGLDTMPLRQKLIEAEPYRSFGFRILRVKNFVIFYCVNESAQEVYIVRILCYRREWQNLL